jgi:hypothetical protein
LPYCSARLLYGRYDFYLGRDRMRGMQNPDHHFNREPNFSLSF